MSEHDESGRAISRIPPEFPIHVLPLREAYLPGALDLWERRFGCDRDVAEQWLRDSLDPDTAAETFTVVQATMVLGVGVTTAATPAYVKDYVGLDMTGFEPWDNTGILHVLAVDNDHSHEGYGSQLVEKRLEYLKTGGAGGVIGLSWHRDHHPDSRALFTKYGFEKVAEYDHYYARTHGRDDCPDCSGECECTASLWARSIA